MYEEQGTLVRIRSHFSLSLSPSLFPLLFEDAHSKMILMPSNYENGCAWWGKDASYGKKGENVWSHGGFMEGIRTHIFVWPERKSGSFVLLNGEGDYTRIEEAMYAAAK